MLLIRRSHRGVHPPENKNTRGIAIKRLDNFDIISIPLDMQIGPGSTPLVAKGDTVLVGQRIGEPMGGWSVPVHSSVSGIVESVKKEIMSDGDVIEYVTIINDHGYVVSPDVKPPQINNRDDFIAALRDSGLVGLGGAAFPTFVKQNPPPYKDIDLLIINAAECEPYITSDHRIMLDFPDEVIAGCMIAASWLSIKQVIIGVEDNKPDVKKPLEEAIRAYPRRESDTDIEIKIKVLPTLYPTGAEKVLVNKLTGRVVPMGGLPADVGVIVQNVTTIAFISAYMKTGMPLIRKVITLDGSAAAEPGNYDVPVGAHIEDVIEAAGGTRTKPGKIIMGGPMMGTAIDELSRPVLLQTNAILILSEEDAILPKEIACISCGECVRACPMILQPTSLDKAARRLDVDTLDKEYVLNCIECGCCSYVCPSKRYLVQNIVIGKGLVRDGQKRGEVD
jgi:electron transport complex protein RnfC